MNEKPIGEALILCHEPTAKDRGLLPLPVSAPNLRVAFYVDGESVVTIDIGSHDIYR